MKSFDVEDVMAALTEVPDNELVILLRKYSCTNNLVMFYLIQLEIVDRFVENVEV